jgi:hypothetical protein
MLIEIMRVSSERSELGASTALRGGMFERASGIAIFCELSQKTQSNAGAGTFSR